jgi:hypothetical protein
MLTASTALAPSLLLVSVPSSLDHQLVDGDLLDRVHADEFFGDHVVDILDRLEHALAAVALLVAVAQFQRLVDAGAGAARHNRRADHAAVQTDFGFHRRVATAVQYLTCMYINDFTHGSPLLFGSIKISI